MKLYLAGPMSNVKQFNIPAFEEAAATLRACGYDIVSPAELDSPEMRAFGLQSLDGKMPPSGKIAGETWGDVLARDIRIIADTVEGIVFLPDWQYSRGARLEAFVALLTDKKYFGRYKRGHKDPIWWDAPGTIRELLMRNMP